MTDPTKVLLEAIADAAWETVETEGALLVVEGNTQIIADGSRLQRLFENLDRNAIEHGTDPDGSDGPTPSELVVTVGVDEESITQLTITVKNNGSGLPADETYRVFDDAYSTNREGIGLRLAIVEQVARAHDWEVRAENVTSEGGAGENNVASGGAKFKIQGVRKPL